MNYFSNPTPELLERLPGFVLTSFPGEVQDAIATLRKARNEATEQIERLLSGPEPDAELVALAERVKQLQSAAIDAMRPISEADDRFQDIKPEKPEVLRWRPVDADLVSRAVYSNYCSEDSIDELRGRNTHVFVENPDEGRQRRAAELIAALDDYRSRFDAAMEQSGLKAADAALQALYDEQSALCDRMLKLKPATLHGLQALATALVWGQWSGEIEEDPDSTQENRMITSIIRALSKESLAAA
ncbi:hypothetical protein [Bradyrhizobium sp. 23]|uniref:hypothetical protein n=1 Tax=Bradyrhizobium sp. 23 TaxID=2782667 RepID=UPI001FFAB39F|nr:hypothetical protein [Bradyrhizobium sp. 23]MCK1317154.1 hypothetical protein [Bradyrhizobium sp. 23]